MGFGQGEGSRRGLLPFEPRERPAAVPRPHPYILHNRHEEGARELMHGMKNIARKRRADDLMYHAAVLWSSAPEQARAYADLAATGRGSRASLDRVDYVGLEARIARMLEELSSPGPGSAAERLSAVKKHVHDVVEYLQSPASERLTLAIAHDPRGERRYIAVSAEDDPPWRPVNVPTTEGETLDHVVRFGDVEASTRVIVHRAPRRSRDWILYLHGGGSRAEEADALARALQTRPHGERLNVVSLDLPGCGYAERPPGARFGLDPLRPLPAGRQSEGPFPYLDFLDRYIENFAAHFPEPAGLSRRPHAVCGGSLGGNLGLRAAHRGKLRPRSYVLWSPASLWDPLVDDIVKEVGPDRAFEIAAMPEGSNGDARRRYFEMSYDTKVPPRFKTPAEFWWMERWPHIDAWVTASREDREEVYDEEHRRYVWRYNYEQLCFSWQHAGPDGRPRRLGIPSSVHIVMLAGEGDDFAFSNIFARVEEVGLGTQEIPAVKRVVLLGNTGHSIHDERPDLLSREVLGALT